ncbi:unnamed protein product [Polarella glacialis]|uniref:Uncharacterized protein n=1 Tax=Polarella glacialis TaxID=89957 RepID=A0A813LU05_POLGL|nr:unnamed protein product [Polarella glacialis]
MSDQSDGGRCSGEEYCPQLADCYEGCRRRDEFGQACWQTSCCPSAVGTAFNSTALNYYVCTFTGSPCMDGCTARLESLRCSNSSKVYCPNLANCYEACRLTRAFNETCREAPCCPGQAASFNQSTHGLFVCSRTGSPCMGRCNVDYAPRSREDLVQLQGAGGSGSSPELMALLGLLVGVVWLVVAVAAAGLLWRCLLGLWHRRQSTAGLEDEEVADDETEGLVFDGAQQRTLLHDSPAEGI